MKIIVKYFREYFKEEFNLFHHIYLAVFLIIAFYLNYFYNWGPVPSGRGFGTFENTVLDPHLGSIKGILFYIAFYLAAYYIVTIPLLFRKNLRETFSSIKYWTKSFLFIALTGSFAGFYFYPYIIDYFTDAGEKYYVFTILMYANRFVPFLIVLFFLKRIFDRNETGLYGLRFSNVKIRPYFILLAFVLPLIILASFQGDFLSIYPKYRHLKVGDAFGLSHYILAPISELFYGFDFVATELMFRGALVIGLASLLKKDAILPMVAAYAFLHFGKPMGEAISSIFGGYILGVIAFYSRNIFGGIVIHVGIAYLMEIAAFLQYQIR